MGKINKHQSDDLIIVRSDGGITSQISFYALGYYLIKKGYKVKFDLSWHYNDGKDKNGIHDRSWTFTKAFPHLKLDVATDEEISYYKNNYPMIDENIETFCPPLYVDGYPERSLPFYKNKEIFINDFNPIDISESKQMLDDIMNSNSCAVHVRRGDLSTYDEYYGEPASVEYFLKSINIVSALCDNAKFFFFSDEMDWVKSNIIPKLKDTINYIICEKNASDKGYVDLYLMSRAKCFIASKGSFGKFAKMLSPNPNSLFIGINDNFMQKHYKDTIMVNDNRHDFVYNDEIKKINRINKFLSIQIINRKGKNKILIYILGIKITI